MFQTLEPKGRVSHPEHGAQHWNRMGLGSLSHAQATLRHGFSTAKLEFTLVPIHEPTDMASAPQSSNSPCQSMSPAAVNCGGGMAAITSHSVRRAQPESL